MGSYESMHYLVDDSDTKSKNIKQLMDHYYTSSYPMNAAFWQQATIDKRFKVGDQTLWSMVYGDTQYNQARKFSFNLIRRHINMICGYQRKNRKSIIAIPTNDQDDLCDDYNKVLRFVENQSGLQEYFSQAFEGAVDTGISLIHTYLNYTNDPISGDICHDVVAYNNFLIDPQWRKQDFSDCNFIWRRRWVSKKIAKSLLPGMALEIDRMNPSGVKDGRFPLQAELINLDMNKLFTYDEFAYRDSREATFIIDPYSGEATEWEPDAQDEDIGTLDQILQKQPWLKVVKKEIPTVKLAIVLGNKVVYDGPNLLSIDSYNFTPLICYHEPDIQSYAWKIQGVPRGLRDPQFLYSRRKVIELEILESQINSGWIYPVDAVTDPKSFRQSGQGFLIPLKTGHLPNEIQRITAPDLPASMIELSRGLSDDITKISGVNEELLGAATDDKAALLSMMRQGAGLTTLQTIFDKADYSLRLLGKLNFYAIRKNYSKGKISAILGKEPNERFFDASSMKFDICVEEGCYSTTQRQLELQQKLYFREIGLPIAPEDIVKSAFISDKKTIIENMIKSQQQQQQQAQQAQEAQQKMAEQQLNADMMKAYAEAKMKIADASVKTASIASQAMRTENESQAIEYDNAKKELEMVKLIMELEEVDRQGIRSALNLVDQIKISVTPPPIGESVAPSALQSMAV